MLEKEEPLDLEPHEYQGVALDLPAEEIPIALAREVARAGRVELWRFQAAHNHDHPFPEAKAEDVEREAGLARAWAERLHKRLPHLRFVVQTDPLGSITWYQATDSAPTKDDEDFRDFTASATLRLIKEAVDPELTGDDRLREIGRLARVGFPARKGSVGPCERCGTEGRLSDPFPAPTHRGVKLVECGACGARLVHSTRTTRDVVEPVEVR